MRVLLLLLPGLLVGAPPSGQLLEAIHQGDVHSVEAALKAGADPNTRDDLGSTALMHAGAYCSVDCMKVLIAAGADVNAASNAGFTALMWSVSDPPKCDCCSRRMRTSRRARRMGTRLYCSHDRTLGRIPFHCCSPRAPSTKTACSRAPARF